jgi:hypothetical protein
MLRNLYYTFYKNSNKKLDIKYSDESFDFIISKASELYKLLVSKNEPTKVKVSSTEFLPLVNKIKLELTAQIICVLLLSYFLKLKLWKLQL